MIRKYHKIKIHNKWTSESEIFYSVVLKMECSIFQQFVLEVKKGITHYTYDNHLMILDTILKDSIPVNDYIIISKQIMKYKECFTTQS